MLDPMNVAKKVEINAIMNKFHDVVINHNYIKSVSVHIFTPWYIYTAKYIHAKFIISDSNQRPKMKSHKWIEI